MTVQARKDRVPGPAEVWGLAKAETRVAVAGEKANDPDGVAVVARAEAAARGKAVPPGVEEAGKTNSRKP